VSATPPTQTVIVLDVEGVLTPEIWIALADEYDLPNLRRTTKDEPDYQLLMQGRIDALTEHTITIEGIQKVISELSPLAGAKDFLDTLRAEHQVVLLSDTFEQFIAPLMAQLDNPTILCHSLHIDVAGYIVAFAPRIPEQKRRAVEAFQQMNYKVLAAGDSFHDLSMIDAADRGFLFRAPPAIAAERSDLEAFESYDDLLTAFREAREELIS
jgi:phosphoserine / homoserine phosphotransferase